MSRTRTRAALAGALGLVIHATSVPAQATTPSVHFHHVHLNVTNPSATIAFYQKFFGANTVRYRGLSDALFTEKSFILLNRVAATPPSNLGTTLWHIGWAGVDGESEFAWRMKEGIAVQTPITPLGPDHYMYFWGPDREFIEVYTGSRNDRFEHFHLLSSDLSATLQWFATFLGLAPGISPNWEVGRSGDQSFARRQRQRLHLRKATEWPVAPRVVPSPRSSGRPRAPPSITWLSRSMISKPRFVRCAGTEQ